MSYIYLLEFFRNSSKIKLIIYASSSSIYGETGPNPGLSSSPQVKPISVYSASKLSMELISNVYNYLYKLNFIGVRFFSVYGPWGRPDMFYYKFLKSLSSNKSIHIYNFGNHYRSFTYIDDVITNLLKIIGKFKNGKKNICDVFNVGNPKSTNLKEFIKLLENEFNKKANKKYIKRQPVDLFLTKTNIDRERKIFKHDIKVSLKVGVKKLSDWYKTYH